jgi:hypothetical protein
MFSKCSLNVQAVLDTNKGGHCTRLDIYNAVDDMAAVLQMPRTWIYDELKAALTRLSTTIMHSRRTAVRAFDSIWTRTLPRPHAADRANGLPSSSFLFLNSLHVP